MVRGLKRIQKREIQKEIQREPEVFKIQFSQNRSNPIARLQAQKARCDQIRPRALQGQGHHHLGQEAGKAGSPLLLQEVDEPSQRIQ